MIFLLKNGKNAFSYLMVKMVKMVKMYLTKNDIFTKEW